eukprot:GHUV01021415.1.p1 GENE.GHUV01021415.1~~GHUV01021415.1.p1  ORF type:complete len:430 (+),score=143.67 GHUV01021415.1:150-1439(+)
MASGAKQLTSARLIFAAVLSVLMARPIVGTMASVQTSTAVDMAAAAQQSDMAARSLDWSNQAPRPSGGSQKSLPISSSVILFDLGDISSTVRQNGRAANWCALIANNIKQYGSDKINIVMTQYWMPPSDKQHFDIKHFCYRERGGGPCRKFTSDIIQRFEDQLTGCLSTAISQGFKTIMLTPHLDNALDAYQWRNYLKLNPTLQVDGFSYWDIQLKPFANAVNKNLGKGATFLFNLHGELGTSTFGWSGKWLSLLSDTKTLALSSGQGQHASEVQMGFKINFERVTGYADQLPGGVKAELARRLFAAADYIAISAYAPMPSNPTPSRLQDSAALADGELKQWGITLKGKDIYYGEFGLGGGTSQYCDRLAKTPLEAGRTPQYGICWQFNDKLNPWANKDVTKYLEQYYQAALQWLADGAPGGYNIKGKG